MPAAVPLAVAGASLVGGAVSSHAAKSAANKQAESADKALALNTRIYEDQQRNMQPYISGGQQAFNTLLSGWQNRQGMSPGPQQAAMPLAPGRPVNVAGNGGQGGAFGQAMGVTLRAPTGETMQLAANDPRIQGYMSRGAQRIG